MAAAATTRSVQHAMEALVLGTTSGVAGSTGGNNNIIRTVATATIPTAAVSITGVVTVTIAGVALGDIVLVAQTSAPIAGTGVVGGYVSAADTVTLYNVATTGGYTGASKSYNILVFKQS